MINYKQKILYTFSAILVLVAIFIFGVYIGFSKRPAVDKITGVYNKSSIDTTSTDFDPFWKAWNILKEKSINTKDISDEDRMWGATQGLASSFNDPYTVFFPPEENKLFNDSIRGSFSGIGAEVGIKDNFLTIVSPLKDSPAWKSGLKAGDIIMKIGDVDSSGMSIDRAINLIRGERGTTIELTIFREGDKNTRVFSIVRDIVEIPTIDTELRPDNIFVIKFYSFSENSARLFNEALTSFVNSSSNKLILDLRGNPGGYLDSALLIASQFIEEGKVVAIEDFGDMKEQQIYRSFGPRIINQEISLAVLVDRGSASASEILAGALKEHNKGTIIGERTFGKGSVQEVVKVTEDTSLKVTVAKWLTPDGTSISENGLEPDIKVSITEQDIIKGDDPQLAKAVEVINKK